MEENAKKRVDEGWKDQVEKEKREAKESQQQYHEPTFSIFLSSLGMQAMIALGKLENPATGKIENNLEQARFLIDTLEIIKEKTKNNLDAKEESLINDYLFNLRMAYIETKNSGGKKND
ncbi:MAG: DUF1844 domain-containing protein [Candidatus Omnitrophica bacterium]|nr:DUF1844 domain-containing protein [Candidatus Omnitrophota bacterium]